MLTCTLALLTLLQSGNPNMRTSRHWLFAILVLILCSVFCACVANQNVLKGASGPDGVVAGLGDGITLWVSLGSGDCAWRRRQRSIAQGRRARGGRRGIARRISSSVSLAGFNSQQPRLPALWLGLLKNAPLPFKVFRLLCRGRDRSISFSTFPLSDPS